jgi:hypothetical protein
MSYYSIFASALEDLGPFESLVLWVDMAIPTLGY